MLAEEAAVEAVAAGRFFVLKLLEKMKKITACFLLFLSMGSVLALSFFCCEKPKTENVQINLHIPALKSEKIAVDEPEKKRNSENTKFK